jgi:ATP phosphoribosyltransferase
LFDGEIDGLVAGVDWITEWKKRRKENIPLMDLGFGMVDLVVGIRGDADIGNLNFYEYALGQRDNGGPLAGKPLVCHTEFPYIAKDDIMGSGAYKSRFGGASPVIISTTGDRITNGGPASGVVIKHVIGQTEAELGRGADYIVECRQSGKSFDEAGVKPAHLILRSQAGLYASPATMEDPELSDFVRYLAWMFKNKTFMESPRGVHERMLVKANVRDDRLAEVSSYVRANRFCDRAPTVDPLKDMGSAIEIDIPMARWPEFAYGIWTLRKRIGEDAITDILRIPIEQMLE